MKTVNSVCRFSHSPSRKPIVAAEVGSNDAYEHHPDQHRPHAELKASALARSRGEVGFGIAHFFLARSANGGRSLFRENRSTTDQSTILGRSAPPRGDPRCGCGMLAGPSLLSPRQSKKHQGQDRHGDRNRSPSNQTLELVDKPIFDFPLPDHVADKPSPQNRIVMLHVLDRPYQQGLCMRKSASEEQKRDRRCQEEVHQIYGEPRFHLSQ